MSRCTIQQPGELSESILQIFPHRLPNQTVDDMAYMEDKTTKSALDLRISQLDNILLESRPSGFVLVAVAFRRLLLLGHFRHCIGGGGRKGFFGACADQATFDDSHQIWRRKQKRLFAAGGGGGVAVLFPLPTLPRRRREMSDSMPHFGLWL